MKYIIGIVIVIMIIIVWSKMNKNQEQSKESALLSNADENDNKVNSFDVLLEQSTDEVRLVKKILDDEEIDVGISKLGGRPDLPVNVEWPNYNGKPLSFLAQINLDELSDIHNNSELPKSGILYFFYDNAQETWGISEEDKDSWRVIYSETTSNLVRAEFPEALVDDYKFDSAKVDMVLRKSYPQWENDVVQTANLTEEAIDNYIDFVDNSYGESDVVTKVFGYPNQIQGNMDIECQMIVEKITYDEIRGYSAEQRSVLNERTKEWILLFQLDSEEDIRMIWGDVGRLYFWIKKEDLINHHFDDVWMILQCY